MSLLRMGSNSNAISCVTAPVYAVVGRANRPLATAGTEVVRVRVTLSANLTSFKVVGTYTNATDGRTLS